MWSEGRHDRTVELTTTGRRRLGCNQLPQGVLSVGRPEAVVQAQYIVEVAHTVAEAALEARAGLSPVTITVIPTAGLTCPLNT